MFQQHDGNQEKYRLDDNVKSSPESITKVIYYTCGRESSYPRNALILSILKNGHETIAFTSSSRSIFIRYASILCQWFIKPNKRESELLFIGFLGQPLVPILRAFWKKKILFDAFISLYDTICFDRKWAAPNSIVGKLAFWLDRSSCAKADCVLLDTKAHADYFQETFNIEAKKLRVFYVGCDEAVFRPQPDIDEQPSTILFYGSYLPLHGVDVIVRAAALLNDTPYQFRLIGDGLQKEKILALSQEYGLKNLIFLPPVPLEKLPQEIASAAVCLGGPFGASAKAQRVIAGKTYQCLAMGKATIVGDSPANRELLTHGHDAWFCAPNNPEALASAINILMQDVKLRVRLGENAQRTFMTRVSTVVLSEELNRIVEELTGAE